MLSTTLERICCPRCQAPLQVSAKKSLPGPNGVSEIHTGQLQCSECRSKYPIVSGIAVLVDDTRAYFYNHAKGISKLVADSEIPREYLQEYRASLDELEGDDHAEDLESERVNALYLMNHYLQARDAAWWKPASGQGSQLFDGLIREHWDHGPFTVIQKWLDAVEKPVDAVELGCGVGGLCASLSPNLKTYLGIDSSFASLALARHLNLGVSYPGKLKIPADLLAGPVSRDAEITPASSFDGRSDFVVGDINGIPASIGKWDWAISLNAIDMLDDPSELPRLQHDLLRSGGVAIQSDPYIWMEAVSKRLRKEIPREIVDSAQAVQWIYERAGLKLTAQVDHVPWIFFKHLRQIEIYSVHVMKAVKN